MYKYVQDVHFQVHFQFWRFPTFINQLLLYQNQLRVTFSFCWLKISCSYHDEKPLNNIRTIVTKRDPNQNSVPIRFFPIPLPLFICDMWGPPCHTAVKSLDHICWFFCQLVWFLPWRRIFENFWEFLRGVSCWCLLDGALFTTICWLTLSFNEPSILYLV